MVRVQERQVDQVVLAQQLVLAADSLFPPQAEVSLAVQVELVGQLPGVLEHMVDLGKLGCLVTQGLQAQRAVVGLVVLEVPGLQPQRLLESQFGL